MHALLTSAPAGILRPAQWHPPQPTKKKPKKTPGTLIVPALTLRAAYTLHIKHKHEDGGGSACAYETALRKWEQYTGNVALDKIRNIAEADALAIAYQAGMLADGKRPATINKYWRNISAIFRTLGPRGGNGAAHGLGILKRKQLPYLHTLKVNLPPPSIASHASLSAMYRACAFTDFRHPAKCPVPRMLYWRCALVLMYVYAMRKQDFHRMTRDRIDLERGTITVGAKKTRKITRFVLNHVARSHIEEMFRQGGEPTDGGAIWYFPKNSRDFYATWHLINENAGIVKDQRISCQMMRRTSGSDHDQHSHGAGKWILQHAAKGVSETYYLNPGPQVNDSIMSIPLPEAFEADT
jgi:integrase